MEYTVYVGTKYTTVKNCIELDRLVENLVKVRDVLPSTIKIVVDQPKEETHVGS